jgi:hypothetical protein
MAVSKNDSPYDWILTAISMQFKPASHLQLLLLPLLLDDGHLGVALLPSCLRLLRVVELRVLIGWIDL